MSDLDPMRGLFSGAKDDVAALVKPPGSAGAIRMARRRRQRRAVMATLTAATVIALLVILPVRLAGTPHPTDPTPSPTVSSSSSETPGPSVSPSAVGSQATKQLGAAPGTPTKAGCVKRGRPSMNWDTANDTYVFLADDPQLQYYRLCTGERVRVWTAAYEWQPDGSSKLVANRSGYVSLAEPRLVLQRPNPPCYSLIAAGTGNPSLPATFGVGVRPDLEGHGATSLYEQAWGGDTVPGWCYPTPTP